MYYVDLLFVMYTCMYRFRRWSDNTSWTNGVPPSDCINDVVIHPMWRMLLDVEFVCVGRLFVHGELAFEDERDYNFSAKLVRNTLYQFIIIIMIHALMDN